MATYTHTATLQVLGMWLEATFEFEVDWGTPERGAFGPIERYEPGSPPTATFLRFTSLRDRRGREYPCEHIQPGVFVGDGLIRQALALDLISIADLQEAA